MKIRVVNGEKKIYWGYAPGEGRDPPNVLGATSKDLRPQVSPKNWEAGYGFLLREMNPTSRERLGTLSKKEH